MIRYEASGSTAWDSTMDVRKRPNWLKSAENKTFAPKPQRLAVVPPSTTEDDEEDKNNDVGSSTVLVEFSNEQEGDIDHRAVCAVACAVACPICVAKPSRLNAASRSVLNAAAPSGLHSCA